MRPAPCADVPPLGTSSLCAGRADWHAVNREWRRSSGRRHSFCLDRKEGEGSAPGRYSFLRGGLVLLASRSIRLTRSFGSGSAAISSYIACSCFCSHISKGRSGGGSFTFFVTDASASWYFSGF